MHGSFFSLTHRQSQAASRGGQTHSNVRSLRLLLALLRILIHKLQPNKST
jgi:hypothetical protein